MNTLFVIDQDTCRKKLKNGGLQFVATKKKFCIKCLDVMQGKKILIPATEKEYVTQFYLTLIRVKLYEVEDFLQFHYAGSSDKAKYLNILKALCKSELNRHPATKETVIGWLKGSVNNSDTTKGKDKEPTHLQLALAFYYMIEADEVKPFDYWEGGKEAAYKKVITDHKPKAGKTAWKEFQQTYTNVQRENRKTLCKGGAKNFTVVCELLRQYPNALTKAKKELQ